MGEIALNEIREASGSENYQKSTKPLISSVSGLRTSSERSTDVRNVLFTSHDVATIPEEAEADEKDDKSEALSMYQNSERKESEIERRYTAP